MIKTILNSITTSLGITSKLLPITKSEYLQFLACAPEFWLLKHHPEEFSGAPDEETRHIMEQGYAIESLARSYFKPSEELDIEFQCTFQSERLLARADIILTETSTGIKSLVEVKSGSKIKDEYYDDLAFQMIAAEAVGVTFNQIGVLHINSEYILSGELNVQELFTYKDVTEVVLALIPNTKINIEAAIECLVQDEPVMELHEYCGQKLDCPAMQRHHPNLPSYNVFHVSRITSSPRKLQELLTRKIVDIGAIPKDFALTDRQRTQVNVAQSGNPIIKQNEIKKTLDGLQFPLYFLDYETLQYGIPLYEGVKPYQQMVFQWSLHVLYAIDEEPVHLDFLSDGRSHPALEFVRTLHSCIPYNNGSLIVWNKSFEMTRNRELAEMYPNFEPFLTNINSRIFDLMEIFQQQHFVHPSFRGSCSIKDVLPVLAPHLSYNNLEVSHGMQAAICWFNIISNKIPEPQKTKMLQNLRRYCKLDTFAMVEIYNLLRNIAFVN